MELTADLVTGRCVVVVAHNAATFPIPSWPSATLDRGIE